MGRTRPNWPQKLADERRFRCRVRFTRPPGDGIWDSGPLRKWLNERLGADGWALYPDTWTGQEAGIDTYALHLDDHTAIPDLLNLWEGQKLKLYAKPHFQVRLGPNLLAAIRNALHDLQGMIANELNARGPRVTWTMGICTLLPGVDDTLGLRACMDRIRLLGEVQTLLSVSPLPGELLTVVLHDEHRGAVELEVARLGDHRPIPSDLIETFRLLLDALEVMEA